MRILKSFPLLMLLLAVAGFSHQFFSSRQPNQATQHGTVIKVADGDSLTVNLNGNQTKIRLCGIDAPEMKQATGNESKAFLEKLVLNKEVAITEIEQDRYGRMVAEVFVLGEPEQFVNSDLVEAGMAYHYAKYSSDCPNKEVIVQAERIAQQKQAGVWANKTATKPWDYRKNER